eukprot:Gb_09188 [translate_table: standard]
MQGKNNSKEEIICLEIPKALDEANQQEWLHVENQVEDNATRDRMLAEKKNKKQKKVNEGERKAVILKITFSIDDGIQTFIALSCEVDQTSKVTHSSTLSLDQPVKCKRLVVVTSDSEDVIFREDVLAMFETKLQDANKEVSIELSSDSDEMAFLALDMPQSYRNRQGSESNASVFKGLKRTHDLESRNIGNAPRCMEIFLSNMCRLIGNTLELQNLNSGDKRQFASIQTPNLEENGVLYDKIYTSLWNRCCELVVDK